VDALPFQSRNDGKWGMVQSNGKLLFEEEFSEQPTVARNGRFMVKNSNDNWEIYTAEKKPKKVGDEYMDIAPFYSDVTIAVKKGERITIIDRDGKVKKTLEKAGGSNILAAWPFHEGLAKIKTEKGYGMINTSGKVVIEPNYCDMYDCSDGKILAVENKYEDMDKDEVVISILNTSGKVLGSIKRGKYDGIDDQFKVGKLRVWNYEDGANMTGFLNEKGEVILKPSEKNKAIRDWNDKYFVYYDGDAYGLKTFDEEVVIRAKYNKLSFAGENLNLLWAQDDEDYKFTLIDYEGNEVSSEEYKDVTKFYDGKHAFVQISSKEWGMIDKNGKEMKGIPDIYNVSVYDEPSGVIYSDYVDIEALIAACGITANSIGDYSFDMTPEQMVQTWIKNTKASEELSPSNFRYRFNLEDEREVEKATITYGVYYSNRMAEGGGYEWSDYYDEHIEMPYKWTDEKPSSISVYIRGSKINGKTKKALYSKLVDYVKTLGVVQKDKEEDSNRTIIVLPSNNGFVVRNDDDYVSITLYSKNEFKDFIGSNDADIVEVADIVEEFDTIAIAE